MTLTWTHGVLFASGLAVGWWIGNGDVKRLEFEVAGARVVAQNYAEVLRGPSTPSVPE